MRARALVIIAAGLAAGAACRSLEPVLVHVDMPGVSPFPPGAFAEVVVMEFRNEAPLADLDVGRELQAYLAEGLRRAFRGTVSLQPRPETDAPAPSFWKAAAGGRERLVFLAGSVRLTSEVRKALKGEKIPIDAPFDAAKHSLIEQLRWTLVVDLAVISGDSGESLFARVFREDRDYIDLEKPADFAFSDTSAVFRERLFQAFLGAPTIEKRSLLRR
jgi:hypothetical protein